MSQYWPNLSATERNVSERKVAPPSVAVSTVIFALAPERASTEQQSLVIPLVRRVRNPFKGAWALPGGPLAWNESLADAAARTLSDTTSLVPKYFEQLYAFGGLDRSPDLRFVSIVYWAMVNANEPLVDTETVAWFDVHDLPELAFDHTRIVAYAVERLRAKAEYADIVHALLGPTFTLAELRRVYEAVLHKPVDPGNFRRTMLASNQLEPTGEVTSGRHRPAKRYQFRSNRQLRPEVMLAEPELSALTRMSTAHANATSDALLVGSAAAPLSSSTSATPSGPRTVSSPAAPQSSNGHSPLMPPSSHA